MKKTIFKILRFGFKVVIFIPTLIVAVVEAYYDEYIK